MLVHRVQVLRQGVQVLKHAIPTQNCPHVPSYRTHEQVASHLGTWTLPGAPRAATTRGPQGYLPAHRWPVGSRYLKDQMNRKIGAIHIPYPTMFSIWYMEYKPFKGHFVHKVEALRTTKLGTMHPAFKELRHDPIYTILPLFLRLWYTRPCTMSIINSRVQKNVSIMAWTMGPHSRIRCRNTPGKAQITRIGCWVKLLFLQCSQAESTAEAPLYASVQGLL